MAAILTVKGIIEQGQLAAFAGTVGEFISYRREHRLVVPEIFYGVSGPMNTVLMLFRYTELGVFEKEMQAERRDKIYGEIASSMPYVPGSIVYELYQEDDHAAG